MLYQNNTHGKQPSASKIFTGFYQVKLTNREHLPKERSGIYALTFTDQGKERVGYIGQTCDLHFRFHSNWQLQEDGNRKPISTKEICHRGAITIAQVYTVSWDEITIHYLEMPEATRSELIKAENYWVSFVNPNYLVNKLLKDTKSTEGVGHKQYLRVNLSRLETDEAKFFWLRSLENNLKQEFKLLEGYKKQVVEQYLQKYGDDPNRPQTIKIPGLGSIMFSYRDSDLLIDGTPIKKHPEIKDIAEKLDVYKAWFKEQLKLFKRSGAIQQVIIASFKPE